MNYIYEGTNPIHSLAVFLLMFLLANAWSLGQQQGLATLRENPGRYLLNLVQLVMMVNHYAILAVGLVDITAESTIIRAGQDYILATWGITMPDWGLATAYGLLVVSLAMNLLLIREEGPLIGFGVLLITATVLLILLSHHAPQLVRLMARITFIRLPLPNKGELIIPT